MESAPPEQATSTRGVGGPSCAVGVRWGMFERFGEYVVQYAANRQAYRCDRRMGTHVRLPFGGVGGALPSHRVA